VSPVGVPAQGSARLLSQSREAAAAIPQAMASLLWLKAVMEWAAFVEFSVSGANVFGWDNGTLRRSLAGGDQAWKAVWPSGRLFYSCLRRTSVTAIFLQMRAML